MPSSYTEGNKIFKSNGEIWVGRGANIQDTRGCNACTWSSPDAADVKRRIDELVEESWQKHTVTPAMFSKGWPMNPHPIGMGTWMPIRL